MRAARVVVIALMALVLYSCATAEQGTRITSDEVAWIEKGKTTRAEVVAKFGPPRVEFPQSSDFISASTTMQLQRLPRLRKAAYIYLHRDTAGFPFYEDLGVTQSEFWIVYDEEGVVRDHRFLVSQPDPPLETRQHTIANVLPPSDSAVEDRHQP
jgi:hypothetical protein